MLLKMMMKNENNVEQMQKMKKIFLVIGLGCIVGVITTKQFIDIDPNLSCFLTGVGFSFTGLAAIININEKRKKSIHSN